MCKRRVPPSESITAPLLAANKHTCCLCREPRKHVEIHHIDQDPSNNDWENLAVLCKDDHSRVSGNEGLGRRFSAREVSIYKQEWEATCSTNGIEDAPTFTRYEVASLEPDSFKSYPFKLQAGTLFTATIISGIPIDVYLAAEHEYLRWQKRPERELEALEASEHIYQCEMEREPDADELLVLVIGNGSTTDEAVVHVDLGIWEEDEQEDEGE